MSEALTREHELKCWPEFFEAVLNGIKPFEARKNDRDYKVGDKLWLREFEPGNWMREHLAGKDHITAEPSANSGYTGRECRRTVTYILDNPAFCQDGIVILGLDRPTPPSAPLEGRPERPDEMTIFSMQGYIKAFELYAAALEQRVKAQGREEVAKTCKTCLHFDGVSPKGWGSCDSEAVDKATQNYDENGEDTYPEVHESFGCIFYEKDTDEAR